MAQSQGGQAVSKQYKYPLTPGWFALGGFFTTPVLAMILLLGAVTLLTVWPFVPILFYIKRKGQLQQTPDNKTK
jgi:hypothetical protein